MTFINFRSPGRHQKLAVSIALACITVGQSHAEAVPVSLNPVVVSGSRGEQMRDDLPMSLDVVTDADLIDRQIGDIKDLVKDLPNVSVRHAPARFSVTGVGNSTGRDANAGFSIRGMGGNRVLMLVDGTRLPRSYINGSNAFGRDSVALDLVKRVEVVRGPSSVLYGSDGLAGLVNILTYEPADFLNGAGRPPAALAGRVSSGWSGDDGGLNLAGVVAARASDTVQWLLSGSRRSAHELGNMGTNDAANTNRTAPNPQDQQGTSVLGKIVIRPSNVAKHTVTFEHVAKRTDTELLSSRAVVLLPPTTTAARALVAAESSAYAMQRSRLTWDARTILERTWADQLQMFVSLQNSDAQDDGKTVRNDAGVRVRNTSYKEHAWQANAQASKSLTLSDQWSTKLTYGLDLNSTNVTSWFDGSDPSPLATYVPKKYFPDSRESGIALYGQGEWSSERWSITPGIRLERFAVVVISQDGYAPPATSPGVSLSGYNASPKIGALLRVAPQWSVYGNYTSGFRAPNGAQLNGFVDPTPGVNAQLLPNPDLKPETSVNFELGLRGRLERFQFDVSAFTGDYRQLIVDKKFLSGANTPTNPNVFQTINVDNASIWGMEVKGSVDWGVLGAGSLTSPFAFGVARGRDNGTGLPLNSIDPAAVSVGLAYQAPVWSARLDLRHFAEKNPADVDSVAGVKAGSTQFTTVPAATTLDLSGQWRLRKDVRLTAAIVNLTDRKYWLWSDVQGLTTANAVTLADAYTQPGRHANVSVVMDF